LHRHADVGEPGDEGPIGVAEAGDAGVEHLDEDLGIAGIEAPEIAAVGSDLHAAGQAGAGAAGLGELRADLETAVIHAEQGGVLAAGAELAHPAQEQRVEKHLGCDVGNGVEGRQRDRDAPGQRRRRSGDARDAVAETAPRPAPKTASAATSRRRNIA
jgi:hypothetical protein